MEWNGIKQNQSNEMMYQIVIVKCALAFYHCVEIAIVPGELKKKVKEKRTKRRRRKKKQFMVNVIRYGFGQVVV